VHVGLAERCPAGGHGARAASSDGEATEPSESRSTSTAWPRRLVMGSSQVRYGGVDVEEVVVGFAQATNVSKSGAAKW